MSVAPETAATGLSWTSEMLAAASAGGEDIDAALRLARDYGSRLPQPGHGQTARRWQLLTMLAAANLTAARVFEAHTDALAILAEAGVPATAGTYGVFAAEAPGVRVDATEQGGGFQLTGTKPWCSLGSVLDVGLVTAHIGDRRQLFRVDLNDASVTAAATAGWVSRGLRTVTSTSLTFDTTPAQPIGEAGWYLDRPGFAWGGLGVAACWYGGALGLQRRLRQGADASMDDLRALHIGTVDAALHGAATALAHAALAIDGGSAFGRASDLLARRTRAVVVEAVETTLRQTAHALGPAPLAFEPDHSARVADLELYIRQDHAEHDLAALGRAALGAEPA